MFTFRIKSSVGDVFPKIFSIPKKNYYLTEVSKPLTTVQNNFNTIININIFINNIKNINNLNNFNIKIILIIIIICVILKILL